MRLAFEGARKTRAGDSIAHLTTAELRRVLPALSGRPMNSVHTSRHAVSVHTGSHEWAMLGDRYTRAAECVIAGPFALLSARAPRRAAPTRSRHHEQSERELGGSTAIEVLGRDARRQ